MGKKRHAKGKKRNYKEKCNKNRNLLASKNLTPPPTGSPQDPFAVTPFKVIFLQIHRLRHRLSPQCVPFLSKPWGWLHVSIGSSASLSVTTALHPSVWMLEDLFSLVFFDALLSVFSMLGTSNNVVVVP